eukprot:scaffold6124_cov122-Cylindrotheca_fusiformis.AAC.19
MPFRQIHAAFNPRARAQVAPAPKFGGEQDLIGISAASAPNAPVAYATPSASDDLVGLFQNVSVSQSQAAAPVGHDPFASPPAQATAAISVSQPQAATPVGHDPFASPPMQVTAAQAQPGIPQHAMAPAQSGQPTAYPPHQSRMQQQHQPTAQQPTQSYAGHRMAPHQPQNSYPSNQVYAPAPAPAQNPPHGYPQGYPQGQTARGYAPAQQGGYPPAQQGYQNGPVAQHPGNAYGQHPGHPAGYGAPPPQQQQYQPYQNPQQQKPQRAPSSQFDPFG